MKLIPKPISSPNRLDKFPTPLMLRFLRNNGGSRSRGRSRSSPIFIRRRNEASTEGPEPSSPKVTCMGQVRVKRSKKPGLSKNNNYASRRAGTEKKRPCFWLQRALFCNLDFGFRKAKRPRTPKSLWKRLFSFFQMGYRGEVEKGEKSSEREHRREEPEEFTDTEDEDEVENERNKGFVPNSPPKNALFLMRCKSAPSRASSLAYRFWGSPSALGVEKTEQVESDPEHQQEEQEQEEPVSREEPSCRDSTAESRTDPENEEKLDCNSERLESSNGRTRENRGVEVLRREIARPLMLPRCKSEPARRPEKLMDPTEIWVWKRRLNHFEIPATTSFFD